MNREQKKQEFINFYAGLLIIQYQNEKNRALMYAILDNVFAKFIFYDWEEFFNIDLSYGEHLDLLGKYINITRIITKITYSTPISFPDDLFGFIDSGGGLPDAPTEFAGIGFIDDDDYEAYTNSFGNKLTDDEFKILLKFRIISLYVKAHSFEAIDSALEAFFSNSIYADINTEQNTITYYINSTNISINLINSIIENKLLPKPIGSKGFIILLDNNEVIFQPLYKGKTFWNTVYENNWDTDAVFCRNENIFVL